MHARRCRAGETLWDSSASCASRSSRNAPRRRPGSSAASQALGGREALPYRRSFFESLLLLWVSFLMPRPPRLELDLAPPEKLSHAVGVGVLDASSLAQELVSLRDRGDLAPFHGFFELLEGFGCDQLPAATFVYPAFQKLSQTAFPPSL